MQQLSVILSLEKQEAVMRKVIGRYFVVCVLWAVVLAVAAFAATEGAFSYSVESGEATITEYNGTGSAIQVPATLGGYPVTAIGAEAFYDADFTSVDLPDSVTSIGNYAFGECTKLVSCSLPKGLTAIGEGVFMYNWKLTDIDIPNTVTSIGKYAFFQCEKLETIKFPDGLVTIGDNAFQMCESLTAVDLPAGVTSIGKNAFGQCWAVSRVTLSDGLVSIGNGAFGECEKLTRIILPDSVKSLGGGAFSDCTALSSVTLSKDLESIGGSAFRNCKALTAISIPAGVTEIGSGAFQGCVKLTGIVIPSGVTAIEDYTFSGCTKLETISLPSGIKTIGAEAFYNCKVLVENIAFPSSLVSIGKKAFACDSYCYRKGLDLPEGFEEIGDYAFACTDRYGVQQIYKITFPKSLKRIGTGAFEYTSVGAVYYGGNAADWKQITIGEKNSEITRIDPIFTDGTVITMTVGSTSYTVNGVAKTMDVAPIIRNNRTMLPARYVAEALGATVTWDAKLSKAFVSASGISITIPVGPSIPLVNGSSVWVDTPAFIENDRMYVPVRFLAEQLGATVIWDAATATATITR